MVHPTRRHLGLLATGLLAAPLARPAIAQGAKEVITFVGATFAEAGRGDKLRAWVERFNKSQDRVEVQPVAIPFSSLANTVFTQMGGGAGPDLVRFDQIDFYAAVAANRVLPLDEMLEGRKYDWTAADKYLRVNGKHFGVPFEAANYVLLTNDALVKGRQPKNFDEFIELAKALTTDGNYGFACRATMAERPGFWQDLCNAVFGHGGRWSDGQQLTLNSPAVIEGVAAYKRIYESGALPKGADAATYRRMFWEGKLAMEIDNGGVAAIFNQQAPGLPMVAVPSPYPQRTQGAILAPLTVNANTKNKAACATFLKWSLEPDAQRELQSLLGAANAATVVPRTEAELKEKPWLKVYDDQTPNSIPQLVEGFEVKTPEVQQIVLEQCLRVLQAGQDPKRAMDEAQRMATARVKR